jgi:hypothetical protein
MDLEQLGVSGGAGFITSIFTLLGWNKRIQKLEENKADKDDFKSVKDDIAYIKSRLDKLYDMHLDGGKGH